MSRKHGKDGTPDVRGCGAGSKKAKNRARRAGYKGARMSWEERVKLKGGTAVKK